MKLTKCRVGDFFACCRTDEERQRRDDQIRETIMQKLIETGEKDRFILQNSPPTVSLSGSEPITCIIPFVRRLKEFLRERLVASGWRDELKESCKEVIRRKGLEKVTIEELVAEITPKGRGNTKHLS